MKPAARLHENREVVWLTKRPGEGEEGLRVAFEFPRQWCAQTFENACSVKSRRALIALQVGGGKSEVFLFLFLGQVFGSTEEEALHLRAAEREKMGRGRVEERVG